VSRKVERVPVEPFRDRFLQLREDGVTAGEVARRLDWASASGADTCRLRRALGLSAWRSSRGGTYLRDSVPYDEAVKLAEALGLDPHECNV